MRNFSLGFLWAIAVLPLSISVAIGQSSTGPSKVVPPGPLDKLNAKEIPEERRLEYAPPEVVAVLAKPSKGLRPDPKTQVASFYEYRPHSLAFHPEGTALALALDHWTRKGPIEAYFHKHWIFDLAQPIAAPKAFDEPGEFLGDFRQMTYTAKGELVAWNDPHGGLGRKVHEWNRSVWPANAEAAERKVVALPGTDKAKVPGSGGPYDWDINDGKTRWGALVLQAEGRRLVRQGSYSGPKATFKGIGTDRMSTTERIAIWDTAADPPKLVGDLMRPWLLATNLKVTADGKLLATSDIDLRENLSPRVPTSHIRIYDAATSPMRLLSTAVHKSVAANSISPLIASDARDVDSIAFTPDGTRLYSLAYDLNDRNSIWVWECRGGVLRAVKGYPVSGVGGVLRFTPDGSKLIRVYTGRPKDDEYPYRAPVVTVTPLVRGLPDFASEKAIELSFAPSKASTGMLIESFALAADSRHMAVAGTNGAVVIVRLPEFNPKK